MEKLRDSIKYNLAKVQRLKCETGTTMYDKVIQRISERKLFIPVYVNNLLGGGPDKRVGSVKIPYVKEVARLGAGKTFGELALQKN